MAYDVNTANRVRRILSRRRGVVELKMMGTLTFLVKEAICCCVSSDGLMVRVGAARRKHALTEPYVRPAKIGRRTMSSFVLVGPVALATDAALAEWIERGIEEGARAKADEKRYQARNARTRRERR
jgi:hypothetical protein